MNKVIVVLGFAWMMIVSQRTMAQDIPGIGNVTGLAGRIIKAIDLKIQRMQNETIWLQNAQKVLENAMSKLHLDEITGWVQKQKDLYSGFYNELWRIKSVISYYHRIAEISTKQVQLVNEYKRAWNLLRRDGHFTAGEIDYMGKVYSGILDVTVKNIDQLFMVASSFTTQMSDAKRLEIINTVADKVDENYSDLTQFNGQNARLALQRAKDEDDASMVRWMYSIP